MSSSKSDLIDILERTSNGLLYMSESDYPFEVFLWNSLGKDALTTEKLLQQTNHPQDTPVEVKDCDSFFKRATQEQNWYGLEEQKTVKKYQNLVKILKDNLADIKVYRIGAIDIDIYIVGKTQSGDLVGLSTKVVET